MSERVVWDSTQGGQQPLCKRCGAAPCACKRRAVGIRVVPADVHTRIKLELRKGKQVTVIDGFPPNPTYFKALLKRLKTQLCCGGALKDDQLELQGDQRLRAREFLEGEGFGVR